MFLQLINELFCVFISLLYFIYFDLINQNTLIACELSCSISQNVFICCLYLFICFIYFSSDLTTQQDTLKIKSV